MDEKDTLSPDDEPDGYILTCVTRAQGAMQLI